MWKLIGGRSLVRVMVSFGSTSTNTWQVNSCGLALSSQVAQSTSDDPGFGPRVRELPNSSRRSEISFSVLPTIAAGRAGERTCELSKCAEFFLGPPGVPGIWTPAGETRVFGIVR